MCGGENVRRRVGVVAGNDELATGLHAYLPSAAAALVYVALSLPGGREPLLAL